MRSRRKRDLAADRHAFAQLELGDRLLRLGDHRLLAGDRLHLGGRGLDALLVLGRLADAHVDDDLLEPRNLELVLVAEPLDHRRDDALVIVSFEPRLVTLRRLRGLGGHLLGLWSISLLGLGQGFDSLGFGLLDLADQLDPLLCLLGDGLLRLVDLLFLVSHGSALQT